MGHRKEKKQEQQELAPPADFWNHEYVRSLPPRGKLAYIYARTMELHGSPIILEDMSLSTALSVSECEDWIDSFVAADMIDMVGV